MAVLSPPYALQNSLHGAAVFRQAVSSHLTAGGVGSVGELQVAAQSTPAMSVQVAAGRAWIPGTQTAAISGQSWTTQGMYFGANDAAISVTVAAADPTNPRIDLVVAQVQDSFYSGSTDVLSVTVVPGTPAASPVPPNAPSNSLVLAKVAVGAGATSIVAGNLSAQATATVPRSGIQPISGGQAGVYTGQLGQTASGLQLEQWTGSAWGGVALAPGATIGGQHATAFWGAGSTLPSSGMATGDTYLLNGNLYVYNGSAWITVGGGGAAGVLASGGVSAANTGTTAGTYVAAGVALATPALATGKTYEYELGGWMNSNTAPLEIMVRALAGTTAPTVSTGTAIAGAGAVQYSGGAATGKFTIGTPGPYQIAVFIAPQTNATATFNTAFNSPGITAVVRDGGSSSGLSGLTAVP